MFEGVLVRVGSFRRKAEINVGEINITKFQLVFESLIQLRRNFAFGIFGIRGVSVLLLEEAANEIRSFLGRFRIWRCETCGTAE